MEFFHYVISEKKFSKRKENILQCFHHWGIEPNFYDAVMGRDLTKRQLEELTADGGILKPGAIGCVLSHLGLYQELLNSKEPCVYIFEDDAQLTEHFIKLQPVIQRFMEKQSGPTVLSLYKFQGLKKKVERLDSDVWIMQSLAGSASQAYVINREAAANLLKAQNPVRIELDAWAIYQKLGFLRLYCVSKDLVQLNDVLSKESTIEVTTNQAVSLNRREIRKKHFQYWYSNLSAREKISFHLRRLVRHIQELYYQKD